jgi:MoxR-like ATPase
MSKIYEVVIKTNSTCPQRANVLALLDKNAASFKSIVGTELVRAKYPVYVDIEAKPNLYGFIETVKDGETQLDNDTIKDIIVNGANVVLHSYTGTLISGQMILDEVKQANVDHSAVSPKLQAIIDEKIAAGIVTKEEMDARLKVMQTNKVDEALKIRVVKGYRKYNKSAHTPRCVYVDPYIDQVKYGKEGIIAEGLRNGVMRMAAICEGEKSVGKNVYMETIAWLLGMPLYMITFSRQMSPSSIYGEKSTDNSASERLKSMQTEAMAKVMLDSKTFLEESGKPITRVRECLNAAAEFEIMKARAASVSIVIDQSELYDWMIDGGCLVLNEMNMGESNFMSSFLNPLTDGTGFLFIPGRGEVKMHKDCVLFGTQNADYEGVQQQNEATMSRFNGLYFKQPDSVIGQLKASVAAELKKSGCDYKLKEEYFTQAQRFYSTCMKSVRGGIVSNSVLNIRGFVRALTTVAESEGYVPLKRWLEICVVDTCPTDEREALKASLNSIITL